MSRSREHGFSLTELAIVMVIVGLLFVLTLPLSSALMSNERRNATVKTLDNIQAALVAYVVANRRLPCPANGTLASTDLAAGVEVARDANGVCTGGQDNGVVPWKTLGMSMADTLDAWFNRITYRVGYSLTKDGALDMSACDPAGTGPTNPAAPALPTSSFGACAATCTGLFSAANCTSPSNFLAQKGLNVSDGVGLVMDYSNRTGAAYVLISHGENGYGALASEGNYVATAAKGVAGTTFENPNRNLAGGALVVGSDAPPTIVDALRQDATNDPALFYDDIVIRPTILMLVNKAQLGPRSH